MSDVTQPKRGSETAMLWKAGMAADLEAMEARARGVDDAIDRGALIEGQPETVHFRSPSLPGSEPALRLWLPGYHTPSLNVTKGVHWSVYHRHKLEAAGEVLKALPETPRFSLARRILWLLVEGAGRAAVGNLRAQAPARAAGMTLLSYLRVTCKPLDTENFVGSTKGLTDCLVAAFPDWLPDDAPEHVEIRHRQERCHCRDEEGTWVEMLLSSSS